jgi:hypothetical protein
MDPKLLGVAVLGVMAVAGLLLNALIGRRRSRSSFLFSVAAIAVVLAALVEVAVHR